MWVETARRWAAQGVPTLRLDLAGIGDADGGAEEWGDDDGGFYIPDYVEQVLAILDQTVAEGLPRRFLLAGLCSGAYWALHAAAAAEGTVAAAVMVNPRALFWDRHLAASREGRNIRKLLWRETWRKVRRGELGRERAREVVGAALTSLRGLPRRLLREWQRRRGGDELERLLERLRANGVELTLAFSGAEPLHDELLRDGGLERIARQPGARVIAVEPPLPSHTLEPVPLQRAVHRLLDEALARQLERSGGVGRAAAARATAATGPPERGSHERSD
jgi:hypothetical protein